MVLLLSSSKDLTLTLRLVISLTKIQDFICDLASTSACSPKQPINIEYPARITSGKARSFNPGLHKQYPWLEYFIERDACSCSCCR